MGCVFTSGVAASLVPVASRLTHALPLCQSWSPILQPMTHESNGCMRGTGTRESAGTQPLHLLAFETSVVANSRTSTEILPLKKDSTCRSAAG